VRRDHGAYLRADVCGPQLLTPVLQAFADLKEHGTESAVKAAGKYVQKGKLYEMIDGDIAYWKAGG
jgi:ribosome-binding ATPase YchF (GTP1/OBG family)